MVGQCGVGVQGQVELVAPAELEAGARNGVVSHFRGGVAFRQVGGDLLRELVPLIPTTWLFDIVPRAMASRVPTLRNGEEVVFHCACRTGRALDREAWLSGWG